MALICYLLGDELRLKSRFIPEWMEENVRRRIMDHYLERDDYGYLGFHYQGKVNNWNPWTNSNVTACFLILENDPDRFMKAMRQAAKSLDVFIGGYGDDGGCDEGPGYWTHATGALFNSLGTPLSGDGRKSRYFRSGKNQGNGAVYIKNVHRKQAVCPFRGRRPVCGARPRSGLPRR
jgi:hypothetical protein